MIRDRWTERPRSAACAFTMPGLVNRPPSTLPSDPLPWIRERQPQTIAQHRRTSPAQLADDVVARVSPAEVRQHDARVLETIRELGDVVETDVTVHRGQLDAGEVLEFFLQMMPHFQDLPRIRGNAVCGAMRARDVIATNANLLPLAHSDDLHVVIGALEAFVDLHERVEIARSLVRHIDRSTLHPLQMPLPRVKRDAERVIEMRMRHEDVAHADQRIGTAPDVETDAQLAHAEPRLVTGA